MTASGILVQAVIQTQQHVSGMICGGSRRSCKLDSTTSDFGGTFGRPRPGLVNLVAPECFEFIIYLVFLEVDGTLRIRHPVLRAC